MSQPLSKFTADAYKGLAIGAGAGLGCLFFLSLSLGRVTPPICSKDLKTDCLSKLEVQEFPPSKATRFFPLAFALVAAGISAYWLDKAIDPAHRHTIDRATGKALYEIEHENALEELDEEDNNRREMARYERKIMIEAAGMERTLPLQLKLQSMQNLLHPIVQVQQPVNMPYSPPFAVPGQMPPTVGATDAPVQIPGVMPINPLGYDAPPPLAAGEWFDINRLRSVDAHPVISIIGSMGSFKSKTIKYLAKHVFRPEEVRAMDPYGKVSDWPGFRVFPTPDLILDCMESDMLAIDTESEEYRSETRAKFPERLTVLEEAPSVFSDCYFAQKTRNLEREKHEKRDYVAAWLQKHLTFTRKLARRVAFISVAMNGTEFIPPEHRGKATTLFPGTAIGEAMADTQYFKLGTSQNKLLREQLKAMLSQVPHTHYPVLIYHGGNWYPTAIPHTDLQGNPIAVPPAMPQEAPIPQSIPVAPENAREALDRLFKQEIDPSDLREL